MPHDAALRVRSLSAFKWASTGELLSRAVSPITLIVLTRFLNPGEYGVFVGAALAVSFCQMLIESGIARALVQKTGDITEIASSAFTLVMLLGMALCAILWVLGAPLAALLIGNDQGKIVLSVLGLQIPLIALGAIHRALLERELRFKAIFAGRFLSVLGTTCISVSLAVSGAGVWAMVSGVLVGSALETIVLWGTSGFRPRLRIARVDLASVGSFSAWTLGQDVLAWLVVYADALVVAMVLDIEQLGKYRLGSILVTGAFASLFVPAERVLFSYFSKFPNAAAVRNSLCAVLFVGSLVALPLGLALFSLNSELERFVFPAQWSGIGLVVALIGLREGIANVVFAVDPAYKGVGRPDIIFKVRAANLTLLMSAQLIALRFGFEPFLIARLVATAVAMVLILVVVQRFFGRCDRPWNASERVVVGLLAVATALALVGASFEEGNVLRYLAVLILFVPFATIAARVIASTVTKHL